MPWNTNNKKAPDAEWREYEGNVMKYRRIGWLLRLLNGLLKLKHYACDRCMKSKWHSRQRETALMTLGKSIPKTHATHLTPRDLTPVNWECDEVQGWARCSWAHKGRFGTASQARHGTEPQHFQTAISIYTRCDNIQIKTQKRLDGSVTYYVVWQISEFC